MFVLEQRMIVVVVHQIVLEKFVVIMGAVEVVEPALLEKLVQVVFVLHLHALLVLVVMTIIPVQLIFVLMEHVSMPFLIARIKTHVQLILVLMEYAPILLKTAMTIIIVPLILVLMGSAFMIIMKNFLDAVVSIAFLLVLEKVAGMMGVEEAVEAVILMKPAKQELVKKTKPAILILNVMTMMNAQKIDVILF